MLRWALVIITALSDIAVIAAGALSLYAMPDNLLVWLLVGAAGWQWSKTGGFLSWRVLFIKSERDAFMRNARSYGL